MTKDTIIEVIQKLTGDIAPVADASIDGVRLENLKLFIEVFDEMHTIIDNMAYRYKDSQFWSAKQFGIECQKQLGRMGISE